MEPEKDFTSELTEVNEFGIDILADLSGQKSSLFYLDTFRQNRLLVCSILGEYIDSGKSSTNPVKCIDVLGKTGVNGLLWKKFFSDKIEVYINDYNEDSTKLIKKNSEKNDLQVHLLNKDPAVVLHESGYSFIYLDCNTDASHYFDAAFRSISRNGVIVITTKDDPSLQGSNADVALRRYGGHIMRTCYSHELAARLVIAAMVRSAAKYNKGINVLCSLTFKGSFSIAVLVHKDPLFANKCIDNIRILSHCLLCEERKFQPPISSSLTRDLNEEPLPCECSKNSPSKTIVDLGPIWCGDLFDVSVIEKMIQISLPSDKRLHWILKIILEEARCGEEEKKDSGEAPVKKMKLSADLTMPPFYYNIHKNNPSLQSLLSLPTVINLLRTNGYRASKTHFQKLSIRTNANLKQLYQVLVKNNN